MDAVKCIEAWFAVPDISREKVVRPSHRWEMAKSAVSERAACIRVACQAAGNIESCGLHA